MKKLLLLFLLSFIVIFSFAQTTFPTYQPIGNSVTLWDQKGAVRGTKGIIVGNYTDTTAANGAGNYIKFYPGAQIFTTSDDQIWVRDATATRWINVTTGFTPTPTCGLQSGTGIVTWDSLLVFDISPAIYSLCCDSIPRSTVQDSILLPAADPSNPVYVAIILDANGVNYVRGVPAANPSLPQLTDCQIALTYVLINAGDIVPANVSVTTIYDENYTSEWDSVTAVTMTMDTANTTSPVHLLKDIDVTSYTTGAYIEFYTSNTVDLNNYGILKFYVRLKGVATIRFSLTWYLDGVQQTFSAVPLVISGITGVYQVMAVPISAFRILNNSSVNKLRIQVFGTQGFYLDWIQLQSGIIPSSPIDNGFTTLNVGNLDSLFNSFVTFPIGQPVVNYTKQNVPAYTALVNPNNTTGPFVWNKINLATPIITGLLPVTNIAPGGSNYVLTTVGGVATWVASTPGYDTTFVVNGLHVIPGVTSDTLSLGGSLRENVTIATVASTLTISTATSSINPLNISATTGNGIVSTVTGGDAIQGFTTSGTALTGISTSGVGLYGQSTSNLAATFYVSPSSTNSVVANTQIIRLTSGTAANGIGESVDFIIQKATGGGTLANKLTSKWTNVIDGSQTSQFIIGGLSLGTAQDLFTLSGNGAAKLNLYGSGTFTGTPTTYPAFDASGNIIESASPFVPSGVPINTLLAATGTNTINNANYGQEWQWNSLAATTALGLTSTSTAATGNSQVLFSSSLSGANATAGQITKAAYIINSHTGATSQNYAGDFRATNGTTNVAGYFSASAGTNNYAIIVPTSGGRVGIGNSAPDSLLHLTGGLHTVSGGVRFESLPAGGVAADSVLVVTSTGIVKKRDAASFGSAGNTIYTGDGTLAGNRIVELSGHTLTFRDGGGLDYLFIDSFNDVFKFGDIGSNFNFTFLNIDGFANVITYTAATHTFTGNVGIGVTPTNLFQVSNGSNNLILIDKTSFRSDISANDGTANTNLSLSADLGGTNVKFDLNADDNTNAVSIVGDAIAQTITLTAGSHVIMEESAGNVGIGTPTPTATNKLEIQATSTDNGTWSQTVDGTGVVGVSATSVGVNGISTSGNGLQGNSTSGFGLYAQSSTNIAIEGFSNDTYAGYFVTKPSSTNVVVPIFHVEAQSDGTAANGMGGSIEYYLEVSTNANQLSNELISKWTDATLATRTSQFIITGVNSTTTGDIISFEGNKRTILYGRLEQQQGADVASAAGAIALGLDGNTFEITGTAAITLISNLNWVNGSVIHLMFTSTASLVNGTATSGTDITILLAGAANFTGSSNDVITLVLGEIGGTQAWREIGRSVN